MAMYAANQTLTRGFFPWRENTKLQSSLYREHVNSGAGFEEKVPVIATKHFEALNCKHLTSIKQAQKQAMSGNYFCVTMFEVLFSVTQKFVNATKRATGVFQ